jgi:hypothetical protein
VGEVPVLKILFQTDIGIASLVALVATVGVGIVVTILMLTKVLRSETPDENA